MLDNPRSERIKKVAALSGRSARKKTGNILVEGPQAVRELIRFRADQVKDIYFTEDAAAREPQLFEAAQDAIRWVHLMTSEVSTKISTESQGVVAVASSDAVSGIAPEGTSGFVVLLPETQDPGNLGTIIRTADAMGADVIYLGRGTCEVTNPKVIRSSAGSVFHPPIVSADFSQTASSLKDRGFAVLGTALQSDSVSLSDLDLSTILEGPHAWVFGNEARGLSDEQAGGCDRLVHIPMFGDAESLNVASAAAMCMFASAQAQHR